MTEAINNFSRFFIRTVVRGIFWIFFRISITGKENIPKDGSFILMANHSSFLDAMVVQVAIPRRIYWIARKEVHQKPLVKWVAGVFGSIPVNGAVDKALAALDKGKALGVFPEGTRSSDGNIKSGTTGGALLALRSGAVIVPVGIKGTFEALPMGSKIPRPHPIMIKVGRPFSFEKNLDEKLTKELLLEKSDIIMSRLKDLLEA